MANKFMQKLTLILVLALISCHSKVVDMSIHIVYKGNYDHAMDVFISNYNKVIEDKAYQTNYIVKNDLMLENLKNYIERNHSKKVFKSNKLKVTVDVHNYSTILYFNAQDGVKLIDYIIQNVSVKDDSKNIYQNNNSFVNSELPPFKNHLKKY